MMLKTRIVDYYDFLPEPEKAPGDIWCHLPTYGLIGKEKVSGIVITPACDLSQKKVSTVTYLPIVTVNEYFSTTLALREIIPAINMLFLNLKLNCTISWSNSDFSLDQIRDLGDTRTFFESEKTKVSQNGKNHESIAKIEVGLKILDRILSPNMSEIPPKDLAALFGDKEWKKRKRNIINNSHYSDLYFLPADNQEISCSGIPRHSVALFRFPLTLPTQVLHLAQNSSEYSWGADIERLGKFIPFNEYFFKSQPIKMARLKKVFIDDLIANFTNIYNRFGSPELTPDTIAKFVSEI